MCRKCQKSCCESHCDKYCHQYPFPCRTIEFSYFGLDNNRTIYSQEGIPTNANPSSTLVANLISITNDLYPKDAIDNSGISIGKLYISSNAAQNKNNTFYGNQYITFFVDSLGGSVTCALNFADDGQTSLFPPGVIQEFPIVYCSGPGLARKSGIVQLLPSSEGLAKRTIKIIFDN